MLNRYLALGAAVIMGAAVPALAQQGNYGAFEVAPFYGYQVGGSFNQQATSQQATSQSLSLNDHGAFAIALDLPVDSSSRYELFYDRQSTQITGGTGFSPFDVTAEYLHLGGSIPLDNSSPRVQPYLAGGLGVTRLTPEHEVGNDDTFFSMSLALGMRAPLNNHFSVRLEGRAFLTFISTSSAIFCHSGEAGGACQVYGTGSTFFQFAFLAGMAYTF
jgi:opacity protein-like surface antigen